MRHERALSDVSVRAVSGIFPAKAYADQPKTGVYASLGKRALDILIVLAAMPMILPVFLIAAICAPFSGGPVFFSQKRVGKDGHLYNCYKFRTMVPDAEQRLVELCKADPEVAKEWNAYQKLRKDPRITKFGRILRKTSLDELPQLLNVLKGDMSIVGPRPFMVSQDELYRAAGGWAYYRMRPGITGAWQVSSRNGSEFADRVNYDNRYYRDLSAWSDLTILVKTVKVVLRPTGI